MAVFRTEKKRDFTVMANHHLRDMRLSLRARGLFSLLLSLPEDWRYSLRGLAAICREGQDAVAAALEELEGCGYVRRARVRDARGRLGPARYDIFERPAQAGGGLPAGKAGSEGAQETAGEEGCGHGGDGWDRAEGTGGAMAARAGAKAGGSETAAGPLRGGGLGRGKKEEAGPAAPQAGTAVDPETIGQHAWPANGEKPMPGNPAQGRPAKGMAVQSNKEAQSTKEPIHRSGKGAGVAKVREGPLPMDAMRDAVRRRIEAEYLAKKFEAVRVEEVVWLLADVLCGARRRVRIGGEERDAEEVKQRLWGLTAGHVEYVLGQMDACAPEVRNIRAYLLACLYNAPASIESYWQAQVCHDMRGMRRPGG